MTVKHLSQDDHDLINKVARYVRQRPQLFRDAGAWLDTEFSAEACLQEDLKSYPEHYPFELPTVKNWEAPNKRLGKGVSSLLGRTSDNPGELLKPEFASRVLLICWLMTDPETNTFEPRLTSLQDCTFSGMSHDVVRDLLLSSSVVHDWDEWMDLCRRAWIRRPSTSDDQLKSIQLSVESFASIGQAELKRIEQIGRQFQRSIDKTNATIDAMARSSSAKWQRIIQRFIPDFDIHQQPMPYERLAFFLCKYANVQPPHALESLDIDEFWIWLEAAADERDMLARQNPQPDQGRSKDHHSEHQPTLTVEIDPKGALADLRPAHRDAYESYLRAVAHRGSEQTDDDAYDWLKEHDRDATYKLPALHTWKRYVRKAREAVGQQKRVRGYGQATKSVVRSKDV